ncbi:hypothetical protein Plhal703r1_c52g0157701 [Plasmopara halstedii]
MLQKESLDVIDSMVIVFLDVTPFGQLSATAIPTRLLARSCTVNKPSINTSPSSVKLPSEIPNTRHVASPKPVDNTIGRQIYSAGIVIVICCASLPSTASEMVSPGT